MGGWVFGPVWGSSDIDPVEPAEIIIVCSLLAEISDINVPTGHVVALLWDRCDVGVPASPQRIVGLV